MSRMKITKYRWFHKKNIAEKSLDEIFSYYTSIEVYFIPFYKRVDCIIKNYFVLGHVDFTDLIAYCEEKYAFLTKKERQYIIYDELDKKIWR